MGRLRGCTHPATGIADFTPMFWTRAIRDRTSGLLEAASRCAIAAAFVWKDTLALVISTSGSAEPVIHDMLSHFE